MLNLSPWEVKEVKTKNILKKYIMAPIELLPQDVPKSLIARHDTESETDIPEERTLSTSFTSYVAF